jgi:hypothetical protein
MEFKVEVDRPLINFIKTEVHELLSKAGAIQKVSVTFIMKTEHKEVAITAENVLR